ncbi:MAG: hypothetical protein AAF542_02050 [Pseudomonadota bacterium]
MRLSDIEVGVVLPSREFSCDNRQLFLYNAVLFNAHRIHYDYGYATEVEGYADLVLAGPLIGDWLHQCIDSWVGEHGRLLSMEYSNRFAAYVDEVLTGNGSVVAIDTENKTAEVDLRIENANGDVIAPGKATVQLHG